MKLLSHDASLISPTSGEVIVDGTLLGKGLSFPPDMGILIEKPAFLDYLSGFENLRYFAGIRGTIGDQQIGEYMELFRSIPLQKCP